VDGAGNDFLAGAGFAGDQNRGVGRSDGFDLGEDGAKAAAAADYGVQEGRMWAIEFAEKRRISTIKRGRHSLASPIPADLCQGT